MLSPDIWDDLEPDILLKKGVWGWGRSEGLLGDEPAFIPPAPL